MTTVSTIVTADSKKDGGIGHVRLEWPVTIRWNERSRSFGIGGHVGVEYAQWAVFPSGKRYNADLNASYNIAAKYFYRAIRENGRTGSGKSSRPVPGTPVTLSVLWQQRAA